VIVVSVILKAIFLYYYHNYAILLVN